MKKTTRFRVITAIALVGVAVAGVLMAQSLNPPFTLTISPVRSIVKVGDEIKIQIVVANTSGRPLPLKQTSPALDFYVTVLKSDGTPPPDTEPGRVIRDDNLRSSISIISQVTGDLGPDGVFIEKGLDIRYLYDMSSPGEYTIQVQRRIPKGFGFGAIKSNTIMITVQK